MRPPALARLPTMPPLSHTCPCTRVVRSRSRKGWNMYYQFLVSNLYMPMN